MSDNSKKQGKIKILLIAGARPNFMKVAPLVKELKKNPRFKCVIVHTGQHYDFEMSEVFFKDLEIPKPDYNLDVGSGSHAYQVGEGLIRMEKTVLEENPDLIIVVGDANSSLIGSLVGAKLHIPVAHVEAGLRSFNRMMPEEVNRTLADHMADYLFATEPAAVANLLREGIPRKKIFYVGNIMIDTLLGSKPKIADSRSYDKFGLVKNEYVLLTLHRQENIGDKAIFSGIIEAMGIIQKQIKIIWPVHLHAKRVIREFDLGAKLAGMDNLKMVAPLGYIETLSLMDGARFVLTDSGGVQEESTVLGVPCLTLRKETERPVTVSVGTNTVVGVKKEKIAREGLKLVKGKTKSGKIPRYWDGKTSQRIAAVLLKSL